MFPLLRARIAKTQPVRLRPSTVWVLAAALTLVASGLLTGGVARASSKGAGGGVMKARPVRPAPASAPDLGPNVYIFTPSLPQSQIQATVDAIADQQVSNQFGTQRFALLFEPGTYGSAADPLVFQVGYYTEVAGLGTTPGAVTINGSIDVYNQCSGQSGCNALDNFWRSLSNLTINVSGQSGCQANTEFWAVSQAAPMRRVAVNGRTSLMDYCNGSPDYASGGFVADSSFSGGTVVNGSQQQYLVRDTNLDGWTNSVWNQVFAGDPGAPAQSFAANSGDAGGPSAYTTLASAPVTEEEPFLQRGADGALAVFVPSTRSHSSGPSWSNGPAAGVSIPIQKFFIANPSTPPPVMDAAIALGQDLLLTPGVYDLKSPIIVSRPDAVVLGLGFPTLVPQDGTAAMQVLSVPGVKLTGMIIDAGPKLSRVLLQVGARPGVGGRTSDPTLVSDVFFRIGGATPGKATDSLVVNSSDVILDDIWAWRADHGNGVGWTSNVADTGLVVNGNDVTAYGLAVEHYQKTEVIWNGQRGTDIFFQNEMPYDVPNQASWTQRAGTDGYPAFEVGPGVTSFQGYGMGSYSNFDQGVDIEATSAFEVPARPGDQMHDILTVFLSGSGGIQSVVDGTGAAVNSSFGGPSDVVSYP